MARKLTNIYVYGPDGADATDPVNVSASNDLLPSLVAAPRISEKLSSEILLDITATLRVRGAGGWGSKGPLAKRQVLHFVYDDGSRRGFRIRSLKPVHARASYGESGGADEFTLVVEADSVLRDLADHRLYKTLAPENDVTETVSLTGLITADVMDAILSAWNAPAHFQYSGVTPLQLAAQRPQVLGVQMTAMEAILVVVEKLSAGGLEVRVNEPAWNSVDSKWDISLSVPPLGGQDPADRPLHAPNGGSIAGSEDNLLSFDAEDEAGDYFSRIMPAAGDLNIGISRATFEVDTIDPTGADDGQTRIYFQDPPFLFADNQMKGLYVGSDSPLADFWLINGTGTDTVNDRTWVDIDASLLTLPVTPLWFALNASGDKCPFIVDADREATYGAKTAPRLFFEDVIPYRNELVHFGGSGDVSEGVTDGSGNYVPNGWQLVGTATSAEETDAFFVRHGSKSVKVTAVAAGDGIEAPYSFVPTDRDKAVAFSARVVVESGRVRLTAHLTNNATSEEKVYPTGEEQVEFTSLTENEGGISFDLPEGWAGATVKFRLLDVAGGSVFNVDAATITLSNVPQPYADDMGPAAIFRAGARYLAKNGLSEPRYRARAIDRGVQSASFEEITLGDYVGVKASPESGAYQIDETLRVLEIAYDEDTSTGRLFKDLTLSRRSPDFFDRFRVRAPVPVPESPPPVQDPHVRTVNLLSDVSGLPGSADNRAVMVRRAVSGGPVINALYVADPSDTTSTVDGVFIVAGSDGVRWKLQPNESGYDARLWGLAADGVTNDLTAFTAAVAAGVPLVFPSNSTIKITPTATIPVAAPSFEGHSVTLDFSGTASSIVAMKAEGTKTLIDSGLTITEGANSVTIDTGLAINRGDTLFIVSNEDSPNNPVGRTYKKGQRVVVDAYDSGTGVLKVNRAFTFSYTTAYIYSVQEAQIKLSRGIKIVGPEGIAAIGFQAINARVDIESDFETWGGAGVSCYNASGTVNGAVIRDTWYSGTGTGYGISIADLSEIVVSGCNVQVARHAVTGGGGGYWLETDVGGATSDSNVYPGRLIVQGGFYAGSSEFELGAIDCHSNMELLIVDGVEARGGILPRARTQRISDTVIYHRNHYGLLLNTQLVSADWGDTTLSNVTIVGEGTSAFNGLYVQTGTVMKRLSLENVTVMGSYGSTSRPVRIDDTVGSLDISGLLLIPDAGSSISSIELSGDVERMENIHVRNHSLTFTASADFDALQMSAVKTIESSTAGLVITGAASSPGKIKSIVLNGCGGVLSETNGASISNIDTVVVAGGAYANNNQAGGATAGSATGLSISGATSVSVVAAFCGDNQSSPTQMVGISAGNCRVQVVGCDLRGNTLAPASTSGGTRLLWLGNDTTSNTAQYIGWPGAADFSFGWWSGGTERMTMAYSHANTRFNMTMAGTGNPAISMFGPRLGIGTNAPTATYHAKVGGHIWMLGSIYDVNEAQVLGARKTAIGALTNSMTTTTTDGTLEDIGDTSSADQSDAIMRNLSELNAKINTIINRLGASSGHGLTAD